MHLTILEVSHKLLRERTIPMIHCIQVFNCVSGSLTGQKVGIHLTPVYVGYGNSLRIQNRNVREAGDLVTGYTSGASHSCHAEERIP